MNHLTLPDYISPCSPNYMGEEPIIDNPVEILENLGAKEIEIEQLEISFYFDDRYMTIEVNEIEPDTTASEIINNSIWWSCCDRELNHDIPICPVCQEYN